MKILLTLLALSPLASAQEAVQRPLLFPPLAGASSAPRITGKSSSDFERLVRRLQAKSAVARVEAINALGAKDNLRAIPYLGASLLRIDAPIETRVAAALALGRVGGWRTVGFLKQSIKDSSKEVRFAAALALGKTGSPDALAPLIDALELDSQWWVRLAAAVSLGESRDPKAVAALGRAAAGEPEWQVRMQAIRSLGRAGSRDAALNLARPLKDSDSGVRAAAALALSEIGGSDSLELVRSALQDEKETFVRQALAVALQKLSAR